MGDRFFNEKREIENDKIMKILSVTGMYTKLLPETENSEGTFYLYMITIQTCKVLVMTENYSTKTTVLLV